MVVMTTQGTDLVQPFIAQRKLKNTILFKREDLDAAMEGLGDIDLEANSGILTPRMVPNVNVESYKLPHRFHDIPKNGIIPQLNRKSRDTNPLSYGGNFMGEWVEKWFPRD